MQDLCRTEGLFQLERTQGCRLSNSQSTCLNLIQIMSLSVLSSCVLKTSQEEDSTTSLGILFQCLIIPSVIFTFFFSLYLLGNSHFNLWCVDDYVFFACCTASVKSLAVPSCGNLLLGTGSSLILPHKALSSLH